MSIMKTDLNVVKMGGGWNWLSVMSVMGFDVKKAKNR